LGFKAVLAWLDGAPAALPGQTLVLMLATVLSMGSLGGRVIRAILAQILLELAIDHRARFVQNFSRSTVGLLLIYAGLDEGIVEASFADVYLNGL